MKKFLVFHKTYCREQAIRVVSPDNLTFDEGVEHCKIQVSRVEFLGSPTYEECIESINRRYDDVISIQPYDVFVLSL